jgi:hypothetical protein
LVADLVPSLAGVNERSIETTFEDIVIDDDCRSLTLTETAEEFPFDEQLERSLSRYLGISKSYLAKCPPDLKAYNVNAWLRAKPGAVATIEALGDRFINIHKPGLVILPLREVADVITNAMEPNDEVVNLIRDESRFHIDITTPHHIEVPGNDEITDRTQGERAVGDITHGGVRVLSNPTEVKAPSVTTYLHRLWCTNGCTSPEDEGTIRIKGNTVDQVLQEMSDAMSRVRGELDTKLAAYADMATRQAPGSPTRFARQLGTEYGVPARIMTRILDRVELLPEESTTVYDIQQVFTQMANGSLPYARMLRLQTLAGDLAFETDHVLHRCGTCERLLPE